jgi:hypothetical protein
MRQLNGRVSQIERKRKSGRDDDDPFPLVVYSIRPSTRQRWLRADR